MALIRLILLLVFLCSAGIKGYAQAVPDTSLNTAVVSDSLADKKAAELKERTKVVTISESAGSSNAIIAGKKFQPNPKKSALFSAILPGSGQIYNREYWKAGLVYAGVGVAGVDKVALLPLLDDMLKPGPTLGTCVHVTSAAVSGLDEDLRQTGNDQYAAATAAFQQQYRGELVAVAHGNRIDVKYPTGSIVTFKVTAAVSPKALMSPPATNSFASAAVRPVVMMQWPREIPSSTASACSPATRT